jgi:hypothetical protein
MRSLRIAAVAGVVGLTLSVQHATVFADGANQPFERATDKENAATAQKEADVRRLMLAKDQAGE